MANAEPIDPTVFDDIEMRGRNEHLISSKLEVAQVLMSIMRKHALVVIYFDHGKDFLLTSLLDVDTVSGKIVLDLGADAAQNRKLTQSDKLILVARLDGVKVQFTVNGIEQIEFDKRPAFRAPLPDTLLRLQRRKHYRLTTPIAQPVTCAVPYVRDDTPGVVVLSVYDLSCGGLSFIGYPKELRLEPGTVYENCQLDLPGLGSIQVNLELRNSIEVTLKNGKKSKRSGCQFRALPGTAETIIQRYIMKVERERNARLSKVSFME